MTYNVTARRQACQEYDLVMDVLLAVEYGKCVKQ